LGTRGPSRCVVSHRHHRASTRTAAFPLPRCFRSSPSASTHINAPFSLFGIHPSAPHVLHFPCRRVLPRRVYVSSSLVECGSVCPTPCRSFIISNIYFFNWIDDRLRISEHWRGACRSMCNTDSNSLKMIVFFERIFFSRLSCTEKSLFYFNPHALPLSTKQKRARLDRSKQQGRTNTNPSHY